MGDGDGVGDGKRVYASRFFDVRLEVVNLGRCGKRTQSQTHIRAHLQKHTHTPTHSLTHLGLRNFTHNRILKHLFAVLLFLLLLLLSQSAANCLFRTLIDF